MKKSNDLIILNICNKNCLKNLNDNPKRQMDWNVFCWSKEGTECEEGAENSDEVT